MNKLFKFLLLFFVAFSFMTVSFNVKALSAPKLIIVNPGEDSSTQMNISYHTTDNDTYVAYYTAGEQNGGITNPPGIMQYATPECKPVPFSGQTELQCTVELNNLFPNKKYLYKIMGTSMTTENSFKTAGGDEFTFAHVTDIHSYKSGAANTRVATANKVLNKLNSIKELDFVLASGDVTAYGTVYEQWEALYGMDVLKSNMFAVTPGNHDYYDTSAKVIGIEYFNSVTNNPKNGAVGVINSSYYFKYGNALFVSLNSEEAANNPTLRTSQIKWLNEVTANNPADFIIAFTHRPFYTGDGLNAGQANDMRSYFQEVFDNTSVDLVLSGHNHVYARTVPVYKNSAVNSTPNLTPYLGTTYITGIQIGDRYITSPGTKPALVDVAHLGANQDGGNLITVSKDKISIEFVKADGTRLYPVEIKSKSAMVNKQEIDASINFEKVQDTIKLNYQLPIPGLIKKINVYDGENALLVSKLNPTENVINLENTPAVGKYNLSLEMTLRDGTVISKDIEVIDERYDYGTVSDIKVEEEELRSVLKWTANLNKSKVDRYEIFVNGQKLKTVDKNQVSTVLDKVSPYKVNEVSFRIIGLNNNILFQHDFTYGEKTPALHVVFDYEELELTEGQSKDLEFTVYPEQQVKLEFTSSNPNVATVDANGKITAVGVGTTVISLNVAKRWDVTSEITVTVVEAPVEPTPTPKPEKKGCFESGYIFTGLTILGLTFILRRKKY